MLSVLRNVKTMSRVWKSFSTFFPDTNSDSEYEEFSEPPLEQIKKNIFKREKFFQDTATIKVTSGKGGDGCFSFKRFRSKRSAFPCGGSGGAGGNVVISASKFAHTLRLKNSYKAGHGSNGKGNDLNGKKGRDCMIKVPAGTIVKEVTKLGRKNLVGILDENQELLLAAGGYGGRGNKEAPTLKEAEKGKLGVQRLFELQLKLIADIGLVGYPNAGKTSLLAALTRATPKIASYPFTTIRPYVGMIDFVDGFRVSLADMPGLIEGAHQNKGLGHDFLKHIQRTKGLLYVLDCSESPMKTLESLYNELKLFDEKLTKKPYAIILSKSDLEKDLEAQEIKKHFEGAVIEVSSKEGKGLNEAVFMIRNLIQTFKEDSTQP